MASKIQDCRDLRWLSSVQEQALAGDRFIVLIATTSPALAFVDAELDRSLQAREHRIGGASVGTAPDLLVHIGKTGLITGNCSRRGSNARAFIGSTGGSWEYLAITPPDLRSHRSSISGSRRGWNAGLCSRHISSAGFQDELCVHIASMPVSDGSRSEMLLRGLRQHRRPLKTYQHRLSRFHNYV